MGKKICIDPGHGGTDSGALGCGLKEKDINLSYARALGDELTKRGHTVIYTRNTDTYIKIGDRWALSNSSNADAFISIHCNSDESKMGKGYEVLYQPSKTESKSLASYVDQAIGNDKTIYQERRKMVPRTNLGVLNGPKAPACLVEMGFMPNQTDMNLLSNSVVKGNYIRAMADGLDDYFSQAPLTNYNQQDSVDQSGVLGALGAGYANVNVTGDNQGLPELYGVANGNYTNYKTSNPLVPFYKPTVVPPSYYNDILPEHRSTDNKFFLRIGDCQFFIPPMFINVSDSTNVASVSALRQREGIKIGTGYSKKVIEISLWFDGMEHINGTKVTSPDGQTYYMDGLRSLIAQLKKSPFLPVVNELLNDVHGIYALTILDASYQTVPEMPGCIQARLVFKEFNAKPYIGMPTVCLDSLFCWPLFRWFYQQQIVDGDSLSKFKLPKIQTSDLTGSLKFRLLPEDILKNSEPVAVANGNKAYSYLSNEWAFMEDVELDYDDVVINAISANIGQIVTDIQLSIQDSPTHQYLGSLDTVFTINMTAKSRNFCKQISELNKTVQGYSRNYKNKIVTGYLGIENEFINMFGVETVCITGLSISTIEGFQDEFEIIMQVISYNKTQKEQEKPNGMAPHNVLDESDLMFGKTAQNYKTPIIIDGVIEDMVRDLELYPDLQLPTYYVVNEFIKKLNKYRSSQSLMSIGIDKLMSPYQKRGGSAQGNQSSVHTSSSGRTHGGGGKSFGGEEQSSDGYDVGETIFVDPDFYIFYPLPSQLGIVSAEDLQAFYESYRSGPANGMLDYRLKTGTGQEFENTVYELLRTCKDLGRDFVVPLNNAMSKSTQDMPALPDKEFYKLMFHDMFAYTKRYTMCRAFPTALFLFIDEGRNIRGTRMWSNFYSYHSIIEASVHKDKDSPVAVCEMTLSNVYYSLSTKPSYTDAKRKNIMETFFLKIDEEMINARKRIYDFMNIEPGCRIHVRMGYGSYASDLPVVFNGQIAEIDSNDIMTIIAQSDGAELLNPILATGEEQSNGVFKYGKEPSTVMRNIMCERESWLSAYNWVDNTPLGDTVNNSKYGIEHFGYTYYKDSGQGIHLKAMFHIGNQDRFSYDVTKNIYRGLPFVEESGNLRRTTTDQWNWQTPTMEFNSYMYLYGKACWDVFKFFSFANIDYIVGVTEHNFRSTLFFGQPAWLCKYGTEYIGDGTEDSRLNVLNYNEKIKTYMQAHCIDSLMDIVDNGTRLSTQDLCTCVVPVYTEGEDTKTDMLIYADRNIYPENLRTEYYDTTSVQDFFFYEPLWTLCGATQSRDTARCMGISYLQHSFKNMYQGEITILGDPSIKPYDIVFLNDAYRKMYGPCYVGAVTHSIGIDTGFVTSFKPDLISTTHLAYSVVLGRMLSMANLMAFNLNIMTTSLTLASSATKANQMFKTMNLQAGTRSGNNHSNLLNLAGAAVGVAAVVLTGGAGALVIGMGAMLGWGAMDACVEWFYKVFKGKDNNTIALMPLSLGDGPFVSGIKGQQTLLPGWMDTSTIGDVLQDPSMDDVTFQNSLYQLMNDKTATYNGVLTRQTTGVDILNLTMENVDFEEAELLVVGASADKKLFVPADKAGELNAILYGNTPSYASSTVTRNNIVAAAISKIGSDYVSGQEGQVGPNGKSQFDCSGFVYWAYNQGGVSTTRTTADALYKSCTPISQNELMPGDLVFNNKKSNGQWGHVMIYTGNGKIVHAANSKDGVKESNLPTGSGVAYGRLKVMDSLDKAQQGGYTKGEIDGKNYVHYFPKAICTSYNDVGNSSSGVYLTANGQYCAAHNIPANTKVYIPALKNINGSGEFIVTDTGGPYFDFDINTTKSVGKSAHDVYVLSWGTGKVMYSFVDAIKEQQKKGKWESLKKAYYDYQGQFVTENFKYNK